MFFYAGHGGWVKFQVLNISITGRWFRWYPLVFAYGMDCPLSLMMFDDFPSNKPPLSSGISQLLLAMFDDPWIIHKLLLLSSHLPMRLDITIIHGYQITRLWLRVWHSLRCRNTFQHQMFVRRRRHVWRPSNVHCIPWVDQLHLGFFFSLVYYSPTIPVESAPAFKSCGFLIPKLDALPLTCFLRVAQSPTSSSRPWSFHPLYIHTYILYIYIHLFISRVLQQQTWLWQCSIYMHLWFSFLLKTRKSHGNVGSWVIGIRFPAWRDFNAFRSNSHPERFLKMRLVVLWMRSFGLESDGGNGRVSRGTSCDRSLPWRPHGMVTWNTTSQLWFPASRFLDIHVSGQIMRASIIVSRSCIHLSAR